MVENNQTHKTQAVIEHNNHDAAKRQIDVGMMYMGPLPPASEFAKYEAALSGSADRILTMAEKQSSHRQDMENKSLEHSIKVSRTGQILGFFISILVIVLGFWLAMAGKELAGFALIILDLGGLAGLFIYNRESEKSELTKKKAKK